MTQHVISLFLHHMAMKRNRHMKFQLFDGFINIPSALLQQGSQIVKAISVRIDALLRLHIILNYGRFFSGRVTPRIYSCIFFCRVNIYTWCWGRCNGSRYKSLLHHSSCIIRVLRKRAGLCINRRVISPNQKNRHARLGTKNNFP